MSNAIGLTSSAGTKMIAIPNRHRLRQRRSSNPVAVDAEEMQVPGFWVQAYPAALLRWVAPVGARDDGLIDHLARARDSAI